MNARFLILTLALSMVLRVTWGSGLDTLEAVVDKFPSIDRFLADPKALAEYESTVHAYYGKRGFPCQSFEQVIGELKEATAKNREIGDALWRTYDGERSFRVTVKGSKLSYLVRRPRRALHALWSETSPRRCPSTDCQGAENLSPPEVGGCRRPKCLGLDRGTIPLLRHQRFVAADDSRQPTDICRLLQRPFARQKKPSLRVIHRL